MKYLITDISRNSQDNTRIEGAFLDVNYFSKTLDLRTSRAKI